MMIRRTLLAALAAVLLLAPRATAQQAAAEPTAIGVWRGTSTCLVHPSVCHDEIVVYRVAGTTTRDRVTMDARKIVDGQEEGMGVLACHLAARGASLTCAMRNGVWHFTVRADSLVGELRLPDDTKFRDV